MPITSGIFGYCFWQFINILSDKFAQTCTLLIQTVIALPQNISGQPKWKPFIAT